MTSNGVGWRAKTQNEPIQFEVGLADWKTSSNLRTLISSLDIREFYFQMKKYSLKIFFDDNDDLQGEKKSKNLKFHNFLRFQFLKLRLLQIKRLNNFDSVSGT